MREQERFKALMEEIEAGLKKSAAEVAAVSAGKSEEYELIGKFKGARMREAMCTDGYLVRANEMISEIAEHIGFAAQFVKHLYSGKFPELESLVPDTLEYIGTVSALQNEVDATKVDLTGVLPGHTAMIVRIGASTTDGTALPEEKLAAVMEGCQEVKNLEAARKRVLEFIESRMAAAAPNLSALVGTGIAAKLISAAGGLEKISKMHANAMRVLGMQQKNLMGLSTASQIQHVGFLAQCDLIVNAAPKIKTKAIRVLAGRCALASRMDGQGSSRDGSVGRVYREEIERKIAKWLEPPPARQIKALPVPQTGETKRIRRGGEQARRRKAKYKMTELRKQQNRLGFGQLKDEGLNDLMGADLGMIGSTFGTNGKLKVTVEDTGILKGLSKKRKLMLQQAASGKQHGSRTVGRASHLSLQGGMKSSLALQGDRGIELVEKKGAGGDISLSAAASGEAKQYFGAATAFAVPQKKAKKDTFVVPQNMKSQ